LRPKLKQQHIGYNSRELSKGNEVDSQDGQLTGSQVPSSDIQPTVANTTRNCENMDSDESITIK
jgi:hypothetical protein